MYDHAYTLLLHSKFPLMNLGGRPFPTPCRVIQMTWLALSWRSHTLNWAVCHPHNTKEYMATWASHNYTHNKKYSSLSPIWTNFLRWINSERNYLSLLRDIMCLHDFSVVFALGRTVSDKNCSKGEWGRPAIQNKNFQSFQSGVSKMDLRDWPRYQFEVCKTNLQDDLTFRTALFFFSCRFSFSRHATIPRDARRKFRRFCDIFLGRRSPSYMACENSINGNLLLRHSIHRKLNDLCPDLRSRTKLADVRRYKKNSGKTEVCYAGGKTRQMVHPIFTKRK